MFEIGEVKMKLDLLFSIALWLFISTGAQAVLPSDLTPTLIIKSGRLDRSVGLKSMPKSGLRVRGEARTSQPASRADHTRS